MPVLTRIWSQGRSAAAGAGGSNDLSEEGMQQVGPRKARMQAAAAAGRSFSTMRRCC